jgi:3-dehydroquinate dehydratase-2
VAKILVLHGPNLNLLGAREPTIYGRTTLVEIDTRLADRGRACGHVVHSYQSNAEHELIERLQATLAEGFDYLLLNPAAFTHTSVALRDAVVASGLPFTEIHLSNPHAREPFRRTSYFSDLAKAVICGCGADSYAFGLEQAIRWLADNGKDVTRPESLSTT